MIRVDAVTFDVASFVAVKEGLNTISSRVTVLDLAAEYEVIMVRKIEYL